MAKYRPVTKEELEILVQDMELLHGEQLIEQLILLIILQMLTQPDIRVNQQNLSRFYIRIYSQKLHPLMEKISRLERR